MTKIRISTLLPGACRQETLELPTAGSAVVTICGDSWSKGADDAQLLFQAVHRGSRWNVCNVGPTAVGLRRASLAAGEAVTVSLPLIVQHGGCWTEIDLIRPTAQAPISLGEREPGQFAYGVDAEGRPPSTTTLTLWFDAVTTLQRQVSGSGEFFRQAARSLVEVGSFDGGFILRYHRRPQGAAWEVVGVNVPAPEHGVAFDPELLKFVELECRGVIHNVRQSKPRKRSTSVNRPSVVVPIAAADGKPWGAVYAFRNSAGGNRRTGIRYLEAEFVRLLADSISAAVERQHKEEDAARSRVLLEQAFPPTIVERLLVQQELLAAEEREVSILFCDLRNSTPLSEVLTLRQTHELLADIMNELTDAILAGGGTIMDYYGDGVAAFWNAPCDDPLHADHACETAERLLATAAALDADWNNLLETPLRIAVGIHSGPSQVGNSGSRRRIKYGPRGNAVNLASRLEGAAKRMNVPIVISSSTAGLLKSDVFRFRLGRACLAGIGTSMDLFSLVPGNASATLRAAAGCYDQALAAFEAGNLEEADRIARDVPAISPHIPWRFLQSAIEEGRLRRIGRRMSDAADTAGRGVLDLRPK